MRSSIIISKQGLPPHPRTPGWAHAAVKVAGLRRPAAAATCKSKPALARGCWSVVAHAAIVAFVHRDG